MKTHLLKQFLFLSTLSGLSLVGLSSLSGCSGSASHAGTSQTLFGATVKVGNGTARSFVVRNAQGEPTSIGVKFTQAALTGLPDEPDTPFVLALPAGAGVLPFNHLSFDWESHGHPPDPIYTTPHFDVHFYMVSQAERAAIVPPNGDTPAPAAQFVPAGYISGVDTVPQMGVHYIDPTSAEFNPPQAFSRTFIYGYYKGEMKFMEPMVSKAYLDAKQNETIAIKQPAAVQKGGFYPTHYSIRFDDKAKEYTIALEGLTKR
jgi:hypothetical protein